MKKILETNAEPVRRVAETGRSPQGREVLRELFLKVIGTEEIKIEKSASNKNLEIESLGDSSLENYAAIDDSRVVRRATTDEERENWLTLIGKLDKYYDQHRVAQTSSELSKNVETPTKPKKKNRKEAIPELAFLIEEIASVIISLIELTRDEKLSQTNPVIVRLGSLLIHHFEILAATVGSVHPKSSQSLPKLAPLASDGFLRTPANRLTQAAIEAFMPGAMKRGKEADEILGKVEAHGLFEKFYAVYPVETKRKDLFGIGGFRQDPSEALWETLQNKGDFAVRAQFALWSRAYQETNAEPGKLIRITINQFCDDIGFKRHKGAHKRENKRSAVKILELITDFEISLMWKTPKGKWARVRGPIWQRGAVGEEADEYGDLFGNTRTGDPDMWEPVAFAYAPGYLFNNEEWRHYNRAVALIGQGLLTLSAQDRDKWAVLIGGYIALQARFGEYKPKRFKVKTLLDKTGLNARAENRHAARTIDRLESALDRLKEVDVIADWKYTDEEADEDIDYDNLDSPETRRALAEEAGKRRRVREEMERVIEIHWSELLTAKTLASDAAAQNHLPKPSKIVKPKKKKD